MVSLSNQEVYTRNDQLESRFYLILSYILSRLKCSIFSFSTITIHIWIIWTISPCSLDRMQLLKLDRWYLLYILLSQPFKFFFIASIYLYNARILMTNWWWTFGRWNHKFYRIIELTGFFPGTTRQCTQHHNWWIYGLHGRRCLSTSCWTATRLRTSWTDAKATIAKQSAGTSSR